MYTRNVIALSAIPFTRLKGATAKRQNVVTLEIAGFIAAPIPTNASIPLPNIIAYAGRRKKAFNNEPTIAIQRVPARQLISAAFLVFLNL